MKDENIKYNPVMSVLLWTPKKELSFHLWRLIDYVMERKEEDMDLQYVSEMLRAILHSYKRIGKEIEELRSLKDEINCRKRDRPKKKRKK